MTNVLLLAALAMSPKVASFQPQPVNVAQTLVVTQFVARLPLYKTNTITWTPVPPAQALYSYGYHVLATNSGVRILNLGTGTNRVTVASIRTNVTTFAVSTTNAQPLTAGVDYPFLESAAAVVSSALPAATNKTFFWLSSPALTGPWTRDTNMPVVKTTNGIGTQFFMIGWTNS